MAQSSMLHIRIDNELKKQATETLAAQGLSVSDAARILLKRVVTEQAFPLDLKVPNALTRTAMDEALVLMQRGAARFASGEPLLNDREKASPQTVFVRAGTHADLFES